MWPYTFDFSFDLSISRIRLLNTIVIELVVYVVSTYPAPRLEIL